MANKKITELSSAASVLTTDLVPVVSDPGGTPATKKATLQVLLDLIYSANSGLTASRAIVTSAGGVLTPATTTATEIGYVNGVTSAIQTQLGTKFDAVGTFGSAPTAKGISVSGTTITLQPADATNPGALSVADQAVTGIKTFASAPVMTALSASQAVVTGAGKALASLAYGTAGTASNLLQLDANGDAQARTYNASATTTIGFNATRNDSKPVLGSPSSTTTGWWLKTDASLEMYGGSASRVIHDSANFFYNGKFKQTLPGGYGGASLFAQGFCFTTSTTQTGNTANTTTNLFSATLLNGDWNTNKGGYSFRASGTFAATANVDKQITVVLGSTTLLDTGALAVVAANAWWIEGEMIRTGATSQKCTVTFRSNDNTNGPNKVTYTAAAETLASDLTLKITGKGTSASDVVGEWWKVFYNPD